MKKLMLLSLLVLLSISFARPPIDRSTPYGNVFLATACQYGMAYSLLVYAQNYEVYDEGCFYPDTSVERGILSSAWSDFGMKYENVLYYCQMPSSAECLSAQQAFYSSAANLRSIAQSSKTTYMFYGRQAIWSYMFTSGGCGIQGGTLSSDLQNVFSSYRNCMADEGDRD